DIVELIEIAVADGQSPALARSRLDLDLKPQDVGQILLEGARVGILVGRPPSRPGAAITALALALYQGLDGAHVQVLRHDLLCERFGILAANQRPRVAS